MPIASAQTAESGVIGTDHAPSAGQPSALGSSRSPVATLRIVPELRWYHVLLREQLTPARTLFLAKKYDLGSGSVPPGWEQVTRSDLLRAVAASPARTLELWEPLWMRMLGLHVAVCAVWALSRRRHGIRRGRVVSAAMENNDLPALVGGRRRVPGWLCSVFGRLLGCYVASTYSRLVFATEGSRRAYHAIPGVSRVEHAVVLHLPRRPTAPARRPDPQRVIFAARLEERKGIRTLLRAWDEVEIAQPGAELVVVGGGPLSAEVERWSRAGRRRVFLGELDHDATTDAIAEAAVLVLPSQRDGRWREQVGLPLHEALTAGATIVTTDESGLAPWLADHGHHVLPLDRVATGLGPAIVAALRQPLDRAGVVAQLPDEDARVAQNRWLHDG
jgi:glycosyltransferase involved in cell wall biosynthesis